MNSARKVDGRKLIGMMFDSASVDDFARLWDADKDPKAWGALLHMCYWEESYVSVGGDEGYKENPPICRERLYYLRELIDYLEKLGVQADA